MLDDVVRALQIQIGAITEVQRNVTMTAGLTAIARAGAREFWVMEGTEARVGEEILSHLQRAADDLAGAQGALTLARRAAEEYARRLHG